MEGEKREAVRGSTKFGYEEKQRRGMLTGGAGISKKDFFFFFFKMDEVPGHVDMFLGKISGKEEISDFSSEGRTRAKA